MLVHLLTLVLYYHFRQFSRSIALSGGSQGSGVTVGPARIFSRPFSRKATFDRPFSGTLTAALDSLFLCLRALGLRPITGPA